MFSEVFRKWVSSILFPLLCKICKFVSIKLSELVASIAPIRHFDFKFLNTLSATDIKKKKLQGDLHIMFPF